MLDLANALGGLSAVQKQYLMLHHQKVTAAYGDPLFYGEQNTIKNIDEILNEEKLLLLIEE